MTNRHREPTQIDFAAPHITDDDVDAVCRVLRSGWLTTGRECLELERALAEYLHAPDVVALSSCTAALETAFAWLQLRENARVGVPTWTFVSSALAPMKHGAQPVLIDVDEETMNVSPAALESALSQGLDAIVLVHFGGVPVDDTVWSLCAAAGVPVVEDAAHALGASDHRGRVSGAGAVAACLSFYVTKNLTSGEGGALVTHDGDLAEFARAYRLHGLSHDSWARYEPGRDAGYDLVTAGIKANLPDVLAALARSQLRRFDEMQAIRQRLSRRYRDRLADVREIRCHPLEPTAGSAHHLMVVSLPDSIDRAEVVQELAAVGIATSVHFRPLHTFRLFAERCVVAQRGYPTADKLASRVLSLPLHPSMDESDVDRVCDMLKAAV